MDNTDPDKLIVPTIEALQGLRVRRRGHHRRSTARRSCARASPQPNVVIEDFIDYDDLFPHVDVFVTSGGFGSNLAAFLHGVPVVGAGKREGKNDINARVGYNGLGIDLRSERPKPAAIRKAAHKLIEDPAYAATVAALRAELETYDPIAIIENAVRSTEGREAPR